MSNKIPNKAGTEPLSFRSFTKDWESDSIIRDLIFNEAAYITAERMARASAIIADETRLRESLMGGKQPCGPSPEKTPPVPQFLVPASQAPSTFALARCFLCKLCEDCFVNLEEMQKIDGV